jgi:hypothetical protein
MTFHPREIGGRQHGCVKWYIGSPQAKLANLMAGVTIWIVSGAR